MKKIIVILSIIILALLTFGVNTYAASLDTINVETSKTLIRPGEEVKVTINFGQTLGSYTFDIAYDNNIFEYVSADGGTPNDTKDKVRVVFFDSSGGSNSRNYMSVIFRAKAGIKGSSPTEFKITGEGLANADASVTFDDIAMPITKNVTVEPEQTQTTPPVADGSNPGTTEPETTTPEENIPEQTTEEEIVPEAELEENVTETPTKLPKTGTNMYIPIVGILFILIGLSVYYNKRKK